MRELHDPPNAARYVGQSVATLATKRCRGGGPAYIKAGRRVLYDRADLDAWLDARRYQNTSEASAARARCATAKPANAA